MTEILFYHMERSPLERVLPGLLARSLERGWRVVVQVGSDERLEALNTLLWSYEDASFLPHGSAADGYPEDQPIWLTTGTDNPNGAAVRFLVDGAEMADAGPYQRIVILFDERDAERLAKARSAWKAAQATGNATYWRQDENGRWAKQG